VWRKFNASEGDDNVPTRNRDICFSDHAYSKRGIGECQTAIGARSLGTRAGL